MNYHRHKRGRPRRYSRRRKAVKSKDEAVKPEHMAVYQTLRDEIIYWEGQRQTMFIYMYTIYTAILVFALANHYGFILISYFTIIPFQAKIIEINHFEQKVTIYLRVFFEDGNNGIHWEHVHIFRKMIDIGIKDKNKLWKIICRTNSVQLSVLSTVFIAYFALLDILKSNDQATIAVAVLILITSLLLLKFSACLQDTHKRDDRARAKEIEHAMAEYKALIDRNEFSPQKIVEYWSNVNSTSKKTLADRIKPKVSSIN